MDWPIDPDAFAHTISIVHRKYGLPVYVLENGTANHDAIAADGSVSDPSRIDYLRAYTDAMFKVMADGVDVRGYFVWSLLDNFEWASGLKMRFGLVYVDYPTQRRIPKTSFGWYADLIQRAASRKKASGTTARKKAAAPSKAARSKRKRTKTAASKPEASKKAKMANAKTKARPVKSKRAKRSRMNDARAKTARSNLRSRTTGRR